MQASDIIRMGGMWQFFGKCYHCGKTTAMISLSRRHPPETDHKDENGEDVRGGDWFGACSRCERKSKKRG